ncbi:MAG: 30S ribosomal protein S21 [Chloroflexi bacterium]|nr:30S ribosomal protein S21 [Chloroflexota bacterium]
MVEVKNREGESFEAMLRRFTRSVQHEGIISEARRRKAFEPPSVTRKKQLAGKLRKSRKSTEKNA